MKLPFGKYKDKHIEANLDNNPVPNSYLIWLLDEKWFKYKYNDYYKLVEKELEIRKRSHLVIEESQ